MLRSKRLFRFRGSTLATYARLIPLLLSLALVVLEGWNEWQSYHDHLMTTEKAIRNLARSLVQHADDTIKEADSVLVALVDRVETTGIDHQEVPALIQALQEQQASMPRIRHIFVFGGNGRLIATSNPEPNAALNASDRDYFNHHRLSQDPGPYIGPLIQARGDHHWLLTVSRRINDQAGGFAGVAVITIEAGYFSQYYGSFDMGQNGSITLMSSAGILLSRQPWNDQVVGRDYSQSSFFKDEQSKTESGVRHYTAKLDGVERLGAFHRSRSYPLITFVAVAKDSAFADWRQMAWLRALVIMGLIAIALYMGSHLGRLIGAKAATEAELAASELRFRALAENSNDIIGQANLNGLIEYISPASAGLLGSPNDLWGSPLQHLVEAEDRPALTNLFTSLRKGEMTKGVLAYRLHCSDGSILWVEGTFRRISTMTTARGVVVFAMRDITAQRAREDDLSHRANTDSLTGLANRRHFDAILEVEWRREGRSQQPLSLLLFDLDRFKQYNDTYGHPAGDLVLKAVAAAARASADRASDLVARYGGEEFAVILPGTPTSAAPVVAERIRGAIRALALAHSHNSPDQIVTVSIGVATVGWDGRHQAGSPAELIAQADQALYQAKHSGRDRVISYAATVA